MAQVAKNYSRIQLPATAHGKNVAARLDVGQLSDITKVDAVDTFERPIYAGSVIATLQCADAIKVLTFCTTGFDAAASGGGSATVETCSRRRQRQERLSGQRDRREGPARADGGQNHRQRWESHGQQREVQRGAHAADRQAWRRGGCQPRRSYTLPAASARPSSTWRA